MNKLQRLQRDQENIETQKEQDRIQSKIVYMMPYGKGTSEYLNTLAMFRNIIRDNPDCQIHECLTCDACGAIDGTVEEVEFPTCKVNFCNACFGGD
ncbi:MAG: hypothetical protein ACYTFW_01100 [Planctomycetota bacterium]|jgi:DNA gyrase inhibitor GyrI